MLHHYNILIQGKVQSVGFRYSARIMAQYIGITGFVKNTFDGSVYIEIEGDELKTTEFIKWCYVGPQNAIVDDVIIKEEELQHFSTFEIMR